VAGEDVLDLLQPQAGDQLRQDQLAVLRDRSRRFLSSGKHVRTILGLSARHRTESVGAWPEGRAPWPMPSSPGLSGSPWSGGARKAKRRPWGEGRRLANAAPRLARIALAEVGRLWNGRRRCQAALWRGAVV